MLRVEDGTDAPLTVTRLFFWIVGDRAADDKVDRFKGDDMALVGAVSPLLSEGTLNGEGAS